MTNGRKDPGIQAVGNVFRDMHIDTEWSVVKERGFEWWGHRFRQQVRAEPCFEDDGLHISKVHAETDFFRLDDLTSDTVGKLGLFMRHATLSGAVVSAESRRIALRCSAFVHEENLNWLSRLFSLAVVLQCAEVAARADELGALLGLKPDPSEHPWSGSRTSPDEMLSLPDAVLNEGKSRRFGIGEQEFRELSDTLERHGLTPNADEKGLTAYVPVNGSDGLLQAGKVEHPALGPGLIFLLHLPPEEIPAGLSAGEAAITLNTLEQEAERTGHFLGSWCMDWTERGDTATFVTFLPAVLCEEGIMVNLVFSALARAKWAERTFIKGILSGRLLSGETVSGMREGLSFFTKTEVNRRNFPNPRNFVDSLK